MDLIYELKLLFVFLLDFLSCVVKEEAGEPDHLNLCRSDGVHVGLGPEVVEGEPGVSPLESDGELCLVGGEDGVQAGDRLQPDTGEDWQLGVSPRHWRSQKLVVA